MNIGYFPASAPFLAALARLWLAQTGENADGLIILPSRRAAQALAGAFLEQNNGKALLLPRIIAPGAIDEAGLVLSAGLDLPPAIAPLRRQAILAQLILKRGGANGAPTRLHAAWALAADLAALLDEADLAEINLAEALPNVVAAELAQHWQTTLTFLEIITKAWPDILADLGCMNLGARQAALIEAQNAAWRAAPPAHRVWMVTSQASPALARVARTVAGLPQGLVILPGYDDRLSDEAWEALDDSHAQAGIARLLGAMGARRDEISLLPAPVGTVPAGRGALLSRALLPAGALSEWQNPADVDTTKLSLLEARDESENATAIAMILREALEVPGRTAALITPDRGLAMRVAAALQRFGITADDSAGEALEQTPPAVFLRLLARAVVSDFAPLPLLALLQHPLAAAGLPLEICRANARALNRHALRGPRPPPGFDGLKFRLTGPRHNALLGFLETLEFRLRPAVPGLSAKPAEALRGLLHAAEALAQTPDLPGAARLWAAEAGIALSERLLEAMAALEDLPEIGGAELADVLDAVIAGGVVRRPRTKDGHPRIAIWGVREAALQSVDVAVLGGLVEGVWPAPAEPGPWLSRLMRKAAGLPAPERNIGQAAHDFFSLACGCTEVVLATPARRERAPAVPARWLTRLAGMLQGALPKHDAAGWAAQLDMPVQRDVREKPTPRPPAANRPTSLSISEFATLMADPYAIYASKILGIKPLDPLDEESDQSLFGEIAHAGLARFFAAGDFAQLNAVDELARILIVDMRQARPRAALEAWWAARLTRIAAWVVEVERERRATHGAPVALRLEAKAELAVTGGFTLTGRADRIEKRADGSIMIADYKTGTVPSNAEVENGTAPQLPLEALMAREGAFGPDYEGDVTELIYLKLSGRAEPGEERRLKKLPEIIALAKAALPETFAKFALAETAYLASPHPERENKYDVYAGISRKEEWAGEEDSE